MNELNNREQYSKGYKDCKIEILAEIKKAREQMLDSKFDGKTVLTYNDAINDCVKILDELM